jgi:hypothetical protein
MAAPLRIVSGGQSGVDRAALDVAIDRGIPYGGWCPRGGWAEDFPDPPGVLARYPLLRETPLADPAQRTEWNIRDSDAALIILSSSGLAASAGTALAHDLAARYGKPCLAVSLDDARALTMTREWLAGLMKKRHPAKPLTLGVGGPRESEAPGIYQKAVEFLTAALRAAAN